MTRIQVPDERAKFIEAKLELRLRNASPSGTPPETRQEPIPTKTRGDCPDYHNNEDWEARYYSNWNGVGDYALPIKTG